MGVQRMTPGEARDYLARYLFRGEDVFRRVSSLSGGNADAPRWPSWRSAQPTCYCSTSRPITWTSPRKKC